MSAFQVHLDLWKNSQGNSIIGYFMRHHGFTIPTAIHSQWGTDYSPYLTSYQLVIDAPVLTDTRLSKNSREILKEMQACQNHKFTININQGHNTPKNKVVYCSFELELLEYFKRLFICTIVYNDTNKEMPEHQHETLDFIFDTAQHTVTLTSVHVFEPDDPFYSYVRNAVRTLSVDAVMQPEQQYDKVKDFYYWDGISGWKKREELIDDQLKPTEASAALDSKTGIYMLYNATKNEFYVGKARDLRARIIQHAQNIGGNDPIPDFTHYRYSLINMEYYEFLYLIENAAIHDCAMILNMPKAVKLKKSLANVAAKIKTTLDGCKIVNTHERQRKIEK